MIRENTTNKDYAGDISTVPKQLDIQSETPISLSDVPGILPKKKGKKVHYSTVYRWVTKGTRGRILESMLIGGVRFTTIEALNRFFETTTIQANDNHVDDVIERVLQGL